MDDLGANNRPIKLLPGSRQQRSSSPTQDEISKARQSPIYWWYRCLQLNEDYQNCCGSGGEGAMAEMYKDFGNVLDLEFGTWWIRHGRKAFTERDPFKRVSKLEEWRRGLPERDTELNLVLVIPLTMRRVTALRQVSGFLTKAQEGRVIDIWAASTAKRQIIKNKMRKDNLKHLVELWRIRKLNPDAKLYEIGRLANVILDLNARDTSGEFPTEEMERRRMTIAVSRQLANARNLIINAGNGVFPSTKDLSDKG